MKPTTRTATLDDLRDLLEHPPRAYLAFEQSESIAATPVTFRFIDGRYLISVREESVAALPQLGQAAMLVVDEGWYSLELRGLRVRGRLRDGGASSTPEAIGTRWLELIPERTIAWDYGKMRARGRE